MLLVAHTIFDEDDCEIIRIISARQVTKRSEINMSMVRYSRKELNEKFSDKQDAEIQRLLAKGTVPDDQLDLRYS
jgi:hypothetical protein